MDKYNRYFRVASGSFYDSVVASNERNKSAKEKLKAILDEVGTQKYFSDNSGFVSFVFSPDIDASGFKKHRGGWLPKKSNQPLYDRVKSLGFENIQNQLKLIGLSDSPCIFTSGKCYWSTLLLLPADPIVLFLTVPWLERDPKELAEYKADNDKGVRGDGNLDHLLWVPPAEAVEIKSWELQKELDEYNASIR